MSAITPAGAPAREWFGPAWLPPGGRGNGAWAELVAALAASPWAPIADVDAEAVDRLLEQLRLADVPAYAAPLRQAKPGRAATSWRLWVMSLRYGTAEQVLLETLPTVQS